MKQQPIDQRPGFNRLRRISPSEYEAFHNNNERKWGIEAKNEEAIRNGTRLMVKSHISGEVIPADDFAEEISVYGKAPVAKVAEIMPINDQPEQTAPIQLAANA